MVKENPENIPFHFGARPDGYTDVDFTEILKSAAWLGLVCPAMKDLRWCTHYAMIFGDDHMMCRQTKMDRSSDPAGDVLGMTGSLTDALMEHLISSGIGNICYVVARQY